MFSAFARSARHASSSSAALRSISLPADCSYACTSKRSSALGKTPATVMKPALGSDTRDPHGVVYTSVYQSTASGWYGGNATLAGLMWWQLGYKEKDVFPRYTLAFAIPIAWIFFPLLDALPWFGAAQNMLRKDLACNAYRLEAWFVVDSTMNLVPMCAQSLMHLTVESCVEINQ